MTLPGSSTPTTKPSFIAVPLSIFGTVFSEQNSRFLASVRMAKLIQRQEKSSLMTVVLSSGAIQNVPASSPAAAPTELPISVGDLRHTVMTLLGIATVYAAVALAGV